MSCSYSPHSLIVSSKVKINALASIVEIIIGGAIAGFAGMFLAIPILAILKVIFDKIESLEPWGYLMGDDLPKTYTWHNIQLPLFDPEQTTNNKLTINEGNQAFSEENIEKSKENRKE